MNAYYHDLFSRIGYVSVGLARDFLELSVGDRVETIGSYAERFNVGRGTIQNAIKFLDEIGAVKLEKKGHQGTFVIRLDYSKLLEVGGITGITGVMPLPYSKRYEGLATALYQAFESLELPFSMAYMRGSTGRMQAVQAQRYDFAVVSKLAAEHYFGQDQSLGIICELHPHSYVNHHALYFRQKEAGELKDGMRVGIDHKSIDQYLITEQLCQGLHVHYVQMSYNQILHKLQSNEIDAAVWNVDEWDAVREQLYVKEITNLPSVQKASVAVLVAEKGRNYVQRIIQKQLDPAAIAEKQALVMSGKMIPSY